MTEYLPCLYAFFACLAFCIVLEVRNIKFILSGGLTGCISWLIYILTDFIGQGVRAETVRYLLATIVVAVLSEIFARVHKAPATIFIIIGILPLVPGGGLYYTMDALINADSENFVRNGTRAASIAAAIAVGCSLVSSVVRVISKSKKKN